MANEMFGHELMGYTLARTPFYRHLLSLTRGEMSEAELEELRITLCDSVIGLIQAKANYQEQYELDLGAVIATAKGFATALTEVIGSIQHRPAPTPLRMHHCGAVWELVFDPTREAVATWTDEKGRVWRKVEAEFEDDREFPPFWGDGDGQ